ncbi:MAG: TIGR03084 family metal-binding protein [Pseudomonadota bacterium]
MQQAHDFHDECLALHAILADLDERHYTLPTQFKAWTINDILQHLHYFNRMAHLSLVDKAAFDAEWAELDPIRQTRGLVAATAQRLPRDLTGKDLLATWHDDLPGMVEDFAKADPKTRLVWVGPPMSARSSISARLMETWAHGQEIYDLLGLERQDHDRLRNIAHMGVTTYGWTFANRGLPEPGPMPYVRLIGPSGAIWEWGEPGADMIEGPAVGFCQVVTQTRNVADTDIVADGPAATQWMALAQCFAGPPIDPPAPGTRCRDPAGPRVHA